MASGSPNVTALDIDKLRALVLPTKAAAQTKRTHTLTKNVTHPSMQNIEGRIDYQPKGQHLQHGFDSGLPSVVEDSENIVDVDNVETDQLRFLSPDAVKKLEAMSSQGELGNGTQLISQSFFESFLRKENSTRIDPEDEISISQRTYEEGESGHVDITSSFVTRNEQMDDLADSEPVDFSPVQSQNRLTQFPESQRFKTPTTIGRKRAYNGDIIETPAPKRNPLAQERQSLAGDVLGLSQAFAATQAASSPFSNGLPTDLRSDRPSPNVDIHARAPSASSSSPLLRPITDLRRAVTEPATKYVPMKHSQAERERQERLELLYDRNKDTFDERFEEADSPMKRQRRQRERERKAKEELKTILSSPLRQRETSPSYSTKPLIRFAPDEGRSRRTRTLSPEADDATEAEDAMMTAVSEAETEQEAEQDIVVNVKHSSQALKPDEENKENSSVLVPKTVPRRWPNLADEVAQVDASPTPLHLTNNAGPSIAMELYSSEPFRIMESQPSQSRLRLRSSDGAVTSSTSGVLDFVEQSPSTTGSSSQGNVTNGRDSKTSQHKSAIVTPAIRWTDDEAETETEPGIVELVRDSHWKNTVPETESAVRDGLLLSKNAVHSKEDDIGDNETTTGTDFETAPTRAESKTTLQSSQVSSPIHATPPGRRRKRMLEISAEASPRKSQSQSSFNAATVLLLDDDQEVAGLLQSSPHGMNISTGLTVAKDGSNGVNERDTASDRKMRGLASTSEEKDLETVSQNVSCGPDPTLDVTPEISQNVAKASRNTRLSRISTNQQCGSNNTPNMPAPRRQDIFDIQGSPQQPMVPSLLLGNSTKIAHQSRWKDGRHRAKDVSRMEHRLRPENAVFPTRNQVNDNGRVDSRDSKRDKSTTLKEKAIYDKSTEEVIAPNMVLAYYRGDPRGYYPAEVVGRTNNNGFKVQWEGYDPEEIDSYGVKALDLRIGDAVRVLADGFAKVPYTIQGFQNKIMQPQKAVTDIHGYQTLIVARKRQKGRSIDTGESLEREIPVSLIYLDINMWAQMRLRNQEFTPIETSTATSAVNTPLERGSTPSTPSSRRRQTLPTLSSSTPISSGMFANMAFVISYDDSAQKNTLASMIEVNGGSIIYDSFHELLEPNTTELKPQYAVTGFTALLTERHSRKEKYMQALALGLPCLSGKWIEACIKHESLQDWQSYLLPAGESAELDNATRSRILPTISTASIKLYEMLDTRPKLLADTPVIAVVGRGKAESKRAPYLFLIQSIGASQIYKVPDIKSAKDFLDSDEGKSHQWVFVDDKDVQAMQNMVESSNESEKAKGKSKTKRQPIKAEPLCKVAGNELIVQSLILGKLYDP